MGRKGFCTYMNEYLDGETLRHMTSGGKVMHSLIITHYYLDLLCINFDLIPRGIS